MARPNSTVVVISGPSAETILGQLDTLPNVRAAVIRPQPEKSTDELTARELIARAHTSYVAHNDDPLAQVANAWTGYFDGSLPYGSVEVAVESAITELRSDRAVLPDYYIVLDPDSLDATRKHWWFGVLASQAPSRVIPAPATASAVQRALAQLPPGRWWPEPPDAWLREASRTVPDSAGLSSGGLALTL